MIARSPDPRLDRLRHLAWRAGGWTLLGLGAASTASSLSSDGGVVFAAIGLLLLVSATGVLRGRQWGRWLGIVSTVIGAVAAAYIGTASWRGLRPPSGAPAPGIDPTVVAVMAVLALVAVLLLVGQVSERSEHPVTP